MFTFSPYQDQSLAQLWEHERAILEKLKEIFVENEEFFLDVTFDIF